VERRRWQCQEEAGGGKAFNMRVIRIDSFQDARGVPDGAMADMNPMLSAIVNTYSHS
jgi:hypothetical protein